MSVFLLRKRCDNRCFYEESKLYDGYSNEFIAGQIAQDEIICLGDVWGILGSIFARQEYHCCDEDWELYGVSFLEDIEKVILDNELKAYAHPEDTILEKGFVRTGDFLAHVSALPLPGGVGGMQVPQRISKTKIVGQKIDKGPLGEFQKHAQNYVTLATPSTPVKIELKETGRLLDLYRPLLLAIGYAPSYQNISDCFPSVSETLDDREKFTKQRSAPKEMVYQGVKYQK